MDEQHRLIRDLADAREIEHLMIHYFDAVDALDPFRAVEIFTDDVEGDFMTGHPYVGRRSIARALGKILVQYEHTSHHITNHRATIDGDTATALTYIYAFHRMRGSDDTWHLWARHVDELVRVGGAWRVRRRVLSAIDSVPRWSKIDDDWYYGHPGRRSHAEMEAQLRETAT
jgi:ketosteroid isomerase-like protein